MNVKCRTQSLVAAAIGLFLFLPSSSVQAKECFFSKDPDCSTSSPKASMNPKLLAHDLKSQLPKRVRLALSPVTGVTYQPISAKRGRWRGSISGNGKTFLILRFYQGKRLIEQRFVGTVQLNPSDRQVPFSFESPRPHVPGLRWKVFTASRGA